MHGAPCAGTGLTCVVPMSAARIVVATFDGPPSQTPDPGPDPTPDPTPTPSGDTSPPNTTITNSPKPPKSRHTRFRFTSSEPGSTYTCRLDQEKPEACDKGKVDYPELRKGRHEFTVFATDAAGNADQTPATHKFQVRPVKKKR